MRRVLLGVVWFVAFWLVLFLAVSLALSVYMSANMPPDATMQQGMDAVTGFNLEHAGLMSGLRWGMFLMAALAAGLGTWKRVLPGTRQKPAS